MTHKRTTQLAENSTKIWGTFKTLLIGLKSPNLLLSTNCNITRIFQTQSQAYLYATLATPTLHLNFCLSLMAPAFRLSSTLGAYLFLG